MSKLEFFRVFIVNISNVKSLRSVLLKASSTMSEERKVSKSCQRKKHFLVQIHSTAEEFD
jgi:hypothetical protein